MRNIQTYRKAILFVVLTTLLFNSNLFAQDVTFSQPYSNPLRLNAAMMGWNTDLKVTLQYRNQYAVVDKGFTTYSFSALYPIFLNSAKSKLDIGINALNDKAGAFNNLDFALAIGYALQVSNSGSLSFALTGGYVQKSLDNAALTFDRQYVTGSFNGSNPSNELNLNGMQKTGYADVGFGMLWYYNPTKESGAKVNTYLGVSGYHLNQPNESFTASNGLAARKYSFQGGIKILGDNKIDFTPNVIFTTQNGNEQIATGVYVNYNFNESAKIVLGTWYRRNNAMAFSLGFEHKSFSLGYSYDLPTSGIAGVMSGANANEITLSYKLNKATKKDITTNASSFNSF